MDITPSSRILRMLGEIEFAEWQCIAELIDNSLDDFSEIRRSGQLWPGGFKVVVTLPSPKGNIRDAQVVVSDTGRGMSREFLEQSVRAGWSSNDRFDKLGLFGMGFNVSTARLGTRTTVLTTQAGDSTWTGVEIDFDVLKDDFEAKDLFEPKGDISDHGSTVTISNLKRQQAEWLQRSASQLRDILGRVYSWVLTNTPTEIWVGGVKVQPRRPCIWDPSRAVTFGSGQNAEKIPAVIDIDESYEPASACMACGHWQDRYNQTCENCTSESLQVRERRIHGWVGIQRHLDKRDFGIDFLRNGRKILQADKRVFDWVNPHDPVSGIETEYPVDMVHQGGRIVGEIHLDHVPVTYSKSSFEYADRGWRAAMDFLRGPGPILPKSAERLGFSQNRSPIARLVQGYRRTEPGYRNLIPGDGNRPIHELTREWALNFWSGESAYQSDKKWWEAVVSHEERRQAARVEAAVAGDEGPDDFAVREALAFEPPMNNSGASNQKATGNAVESVSQRSILEETVQERLNRLAEDSRSVPDLCRSFGLPDLGSLRLDTRISVDSPLLDDSGNPTPIWMKVGAGGTVAVFIDAKHELFGRFGATFEDALLIELAPLLKVRSTSSLSHSQIVASLRSLCLQQSAIDFSTLKNQANDLLADVRTRMVDFIGDDPQRAIQYLTPDERTVIESGAISHAGQGRRDIWAEGDFLLYAPPMYLTTLLESWPEAFMDGKVFQGPFENLLSAASRRLSVAKVVGYLNDLAFVASAQAKPNVAQLQRARWSASLLTAELAE